jgi:hypothetical protein
MAVVVVVTLLAIAPRVGADEVIDRVLAVAGGELITQSDVAAVRALGFVAVPAAPPNATPDQQTRAIVSALIDRALMLAEVDRYAPPEPSAEAVDGELRTVREKFPSDKAFADALARVGLDEKYLRDILRQNLRIRAYIDERFAVAEDQQRALVSEWVSGLRRRATVSELDPSAR